MGSGNSSYDSIQGAIDEADPGDTIQVLAKTYYENVNVTKRIVLKGADFPVIDAGGKGSAITLSSDGIVIEGFCVRNSSFEWPAAAGITVLSDDNVVKGNVLRGTWDNILLLHSCNNYIHGNKINGTEEGILLVGSSNNSILGNHISQSGDGIVLDHSSHNTVEGNYVVDNEDDGIICINNSMYNTLVKNNVNKNGWHGLELFLSKHNVVKYNNASNNSVCNILVLGSSNNVVEDNTAGHGGYTGISLVNSQENNISRNYASHNGMIGIILENSNSNIIDGNDASSNGIVGLWTASSTHNVIFKNSLDDNQRFNAYDDGDNYWDDETTGNRYGDYDEPREGCKDRNSNGFCDSSYAIPGGSSVDRRPQCVLSP